MPDLVEGEEYEFRILAENEAGMSEPSVVSPPVVAKDPESKLFICIYLFTYLTRTQTNNNYKGVNTRS